MKFLRPMAVLFVCVIGIILLTESEQPLEAAESYTIHIEGGSATIVSFDGADVDCVIASKGYYSGGGVAIDCDWKN